MRGGDLEGADDATRCKGYATNAEMFDDDWLKSEWIDGYEEKIANPDDLAYPCGRIAKYSFNDRFTWIADTEGENFNVTIDDSAIAHSIDTDHKFKRNEKAYEDGQYWTDIEDQHLMVWF